MSFLKDLLASMESGSASTDVQHQLVQPLNYSEPKSLREDFAYSDLYDASGEKLEQLHKGMANDREARLRLYMRETDLQRRKQAHEREMRLYAAEEARQIYARRKEAQRKGTYAASSDCSDARENNASPPALPHRLLSDTLAPKPSRPALHTMSDTNQAHGGARLSSSTSTVSKRKRGILGGGEVQAVYRANKKMKQRV